MKRVVGAGKKGGAKTQAEYEAEFLAKGETPAMAKYKAERAAILAPQEEATQAKLRADWQAETQGKIPYETWLKDRQVKGLIAKRGEKSARRGVQKEMQEEAAKSAEAQKQAYNEEMRRRESSIFTPIVQGLTKVGDFAAKSGLLPPIVSEVYKATAPPGSEFAGGKSKKWIQEAVEGMKEGAFTQQALRAHTTPVAFAKQVLAHPEHFTEKTRKRAQFLVNIQKKGGGPFEVATHVKDLEYIIRRLEATTDPEAKKRIQEQLIRVIARIEPETDLLGPSETEHLKSLISRGLATYPAGKRAKMAEILPAIQGDVARFQEQMRANAKEREDKGLAQLDKDIAKKRGRGVASSRPRAPARNWVADLDRAYAEARQRLLAMPQSRTRDMSLRELEDSQDRSVSRATLTPAEGEDALRYFQTRADFLVRRQESLEGERSRLRQGRQAREEAARPVVIVNPSGERVLGERVGRGKEDELVRQAHSLLAKQPMLPPPEVMNALEAILDEAGEVLASPPKGLFGRSHKTAVEQAKKKMDDVITTFERDQELAEAEPPKTKSGIKKEFAQVLARPSGRGKIQMSKSQFVKEHKKLIGLLEKAGKEGKEQKKELAKVLKGGRAQNPRDKPPKAQVPDNSFPEGMIPAGFTPLEWAQIQQEQEDANAPPPAITAQQIQDAIAQLQENISNAMETEGGPGFQGAFSDELVAQLTAANDQLADFQEMLAQVTGSGVASSKAKVAPEPSFEGIPKPVIYEHPATGRYGKIKERRRQEEEYLTHYGFNPRRIAPDIREKMLRGLKVIPIGSKDHPGVANL